MLSLIVLLVCAPLIVNQWLRYSGHEANQAAMLPFADNLSQARRVEQETGLVCVPDRLALQTSLDA